MWIRGVVVAVGGAITFWKAMGQIKILFLQEIIPSYRVPVFRRLAALPGVQLTMFYSKPSRSHRQENLKNASGLTGFRSVKIPLFELGHFVYQFSFLKHVLVEKPDVVISGQPGRMDTLLLLFLTRLMGIRLLWFCGGVPYMDAERIAEYTNKGRLNSIFRKHNPRRWLLAKADGMIVYSEHAKGYYASLGFPVHRIWIAPNSPDTDALREYEAELERQPEIMEELQRKYSPHGERVIFTLGRLNSARRVDVLLAAYKIVQSSLPGTALVLIGDGYEGPRLEKIVKEENIRNVHFLGAIYDDRILVRYFRLCRVFVTPGIASLAVKNAMTLGRPVISGDYGLEIHAIHDRKNGFIVPVGDVQALAEAILLVLTDERLWEKMSVDARGTIDTEINITRMIEGFRKAIDVVTT